MGVEKDCLNETRGCFVREEQMGLERESEFLDLGWREGERRVLEEMGLLGLKRGMKE